RASASSSDDKADKTRSLATTSDQLAQRLTPLAQRTSRSTYSLSEETVAQRPTPETRLRLETCLGHTQNSIPTTYNP
ncbi:hypothetical protein A2U01_0041153, partial [Trifolium medium]|nr:hypothetical protein [Trifolium medium]